MFIMKSNFSNILVVQASKKKCMQEKVVFKKKPTYTFIFPEDENSLIICVFTLNSHICTGRNKRKLKYWFP